MPPYRDPVERFWEKVKVAGPTECWVWIAADDGYGYGAFGLSYPRRVIKAHIYSWTLAYGEVPDGMCVLHKCDNPPCVNPGHLFLGTRDDNNQDKIQKGKQSRGSRHGLAVLVEEDVVRIRQMCEQDGLTHKEIAKQFGISRAAVQAIAARKRWKHVQ